MKYLLLAAALFAPLVARAAEKPADWLAARVADGSASAAVMAATTGSVSSLAIASSIDAPGPAISATIRSCSAAMRSSSSRPHS